MNPRAAFGGGAARTAAVLGHELRNPLGAALANAALACEMVDGADPRRPVLDAVVRELERMGELLDGYLAFARVGAPRIAPVALAAIATRIAARRPQVQVALADDLCIAGDEALLERALENLVDNALQVGARSVEIRGAAVGDRARIAVSDDGPGVPDEARPHLFEPGYSRRGSTGLGLSIVAETVAAHGGSIACEDCARGSRFVLDLPLAAAVTAA